MFPPRLLLAAFLAAPLSAAAAPPAKVTFDEHVMPVFREKCLGCHNQDKAKGGLNLANYLKAMEGGASGEVVKPGDPDGSRLYAMMAHKEEPYMPPQSPPLPAATLDLIKIWIAGGALENNGSKAVAAKPKADLSLKAVVRGKPDGPPPMPGPKVSTDPVVRTTRAGAVTSIAANPWSPLVAVAGQKQVVLYNTDTMDVAGVLPFPIGTPNVVKFSRNGKLLLAGGGTGGRTGKVYVWDVTTGEKVIEVGDELDAVLAADISADQSMIALAGSSKTVRVYTTKDGQLLREVKKHTDWIYALEFSPDGVLLATADRGGNMYVWEAFALREFYNLRGHQAAITDVSWRADGNVLASASEDGTIRLWEMQNGTQVKSISAHGGGAQGVHFAADGRMASARPRPHGQSLGRERGAAKTVRAVPRYRLALGVHARRQVRRRRRLVGGAVRLFGGRRQTCGPIDGQPGERRPSARHWPSRKSLPSRPPPTRPMPPRPPPRPKRSRPKRR